MVSAIRNAVRVVALAIGVWIYRPLRDLARTVRRRHPVRIFTFHRVLSEFQDGMTVVPEIFREQVRYIRRFHDVVSLESALGALRAGTRLERPLAVLTFDDAYRCVYKQALPITEELGVVATCFATTDLVGTDRRFPHDAGNPFVATLDVMDWRELRSLRERGWTIGAHSATHANLARCEGEVLERELREPLTRLREELGLEDVALAYPFGGPSDITPEGIRRARELGYSVCLRDFDGENYPPPDFVLGRFEVGGKHTRLAWMGRAHGIDLSRWGQRWKSAQPGYLGRPVETDTQ
jgi:peptidoglycan/xylan/chitin deacetylase (PgdA/CDA1 family)